MTEAGPQPAPPERHATTTRGFLFADLRGYTAFVERHGAHRAAEMLDRYRELVRGAVADFDGSEIRTEGDSFYVVFGSASAAIECGLVIVAQATEHATLDPSTAFQVGVGIHAGETVETAEGYVGSAVNTAARICAQAGPNQVLVSDTVRALTSGVVSAEFVPIGRRRLKGLRHPIELHRAVADGASVSRRRLGMAGMRVGVAGVMAAAVLLIVVIAIARPGTGTGLGVDVDPSPSDAPGLAPTDGMTSASASPSASVDQDAYPNAHESELLALVPESEHERCVRGEEADIPILDSVSIAGTPAVVQTYRTPLSVWGGIHCRRGGISAPDDVWYWRLGLRAEGAEWIAQQAGKVSASSGSCEESGLAVERWSFGDQSGSLLCYETETGDAVITWTYDGSSLFGRAIRDDRDMAALLRWWADEARFLAD